MDDPKKAAKKLLEFYEGQKLRELLEYLTEGLESNAFMESKTLQENLATNQTQKLSVTRIEEVFDEQKTLLQKDPFEVSSSQSEGLSLSPKKDNSQTAIKAQPQPRILTNNNGADKSNELILNNNSQRAEVGQPELRRGASPLGNSGFLADKNTLNLRLSRDQLAERLKLNPKSISNFLSKQPNEFSQWTQKKDPEGLAWQKTEKQGRLYFFIPIKTENQK